MKKIEFETLAAAGSLGSVTIYESSPGKYQLFAYPEGRYDGSNDFKTALGETRIWSSLDVLFKFIRAMGYRGLVTLDTNLLCIGSDGNTYVVPPSKRPVP